MPPDRNGDVERGHPGGMGDLVFPERRELDSELSAGQRRGASRRSRNGSAEAVVAAADATGPSVHERPSDGKSYVGRSTPPRALLIAPLRSARPSARSVLGPTSHRVGRTHDGDRVVGGRTLGGMGGNWLDRGHGDGESLVPVSGAPSWDMVASDDRGATGWELPVDQGGRCRARWRHSSVRRARRMPFARRCSRAWGPRRPRRCGRRRSRPSRRFLRLPVRRPRRCRRRRSPLTPCRFRCRRRSPPSKITAPWTMGGAPDPIRARRRRVGMAPCRTRSGRRSTTPGLAGMPTRPNRRRTRVRPSPSRARVL